MRQRVSGLYALTPDVLDDKALEAKVGAALEGGASLVQYRNKTASPEVRLRQARRLRNLCMAYGVPLIINDHLSLALEIEAEGVHLGRDDGDVADARARMGDHALIGVSCYNSLDNARAAVRGGASYVAFGSFFASAIKPSAVNASAALLTDAKRTLKVPLVAIGGIDATNAQYLISSGADCIAVISALFDAEDVRDAASRLSRLFQRT
jgi:thiamine-phosphate pyrophosphorylase